MIPNRYPPRRMEVGAKRMKLKRKQIKSGNLLDMRPKRLYGHVSEDDGRVSVQIPRFGARWMRWLQKRLKRPYVLLHLDEVGTAVWLSCDGAKTVHEIGRQLEGRFGEKISPVWDRLPRFIGTLHSGRLIRFE